MKTFSPNFDVKETADAYVLYGDLPGVEQKDIKVEFTDAETLTVKGRVERVYTSGTPPSAAALPSSSDKAIEEKESDTSSAVATNKGKDKAHQPTVEDENAAQGEVKVVKAKAADEEEAAAAPKERYWVEERSVGEFQRSFTFPVRVDQDAVSATMKNGVLTITVPKGKKVEPRRIEIN